MGLRYIDDLVLRDRSTANNGVINERRYAVQDGNWNTIAICDITGFVGERYAYSAYGTPVFMTGAGVVQASSPIGFETLYAGYRWDGTTPQMYYVRNRFLLAMIGTWNKRDPLGYVDGMNLTSLQHCIRTTDPSGLAIVEGITTCKKIRKCVKYTDAELHSLQAANSRIDKLLQAYANNIPMNELPMSTYGQGGKVTNPAAIAGLPQCVKDCFLSVETSWMIAVDSLHLAMRSGVNWPSNWNFRGIQVQNNVIEAVRQARLACCIAGSCGKKDYGFGCCVYWLNRAVITLA